MRKRSALAILTLLSLIIFFSGCEKPDEKEPVIVDQLIVSKAELIVQNSFPLVQNEEIKIYVIENAFKGTHRLTPEKYLWSILDKEGKVIKDDFDNQALRIGWIAEETGKYTVNLTLQYDSISTKDVNRELDIETDPRIIYAGDYHFERNYSTWDDTNGVDKKPTTFYEGYVKPDYNNKKNLIIRCGEGVLGSWSDCFYMKILDSENNFITSYNFPTTHGSFTCEFTGTDSLTIKYSGGGLGGGFNYNIYGKKR